MQKARPVRAFLLSGAHVGLLAVGGFVLCFSANFQFIGRTPVFDGSELGFPAGVLPMADTFLSAANLGFVIDGRRTAQRLGRTASSGQIQAPQRVELSSGLQGDDGRSPIRVNVADANALVRVAATAGFGVVEGLRALRDLVELANQDGLVNPSANILTADGTRFSQINLQSSASRLIAGLSDLVNGAEVGGANLISGRSRSVALQTSDFGGQVVIRPRALDPASLGIDDLDLTSEAGLNRAVEQANNALVAAQSRLDEINQLQDALNAGSGFAQSLGLALSGGAGDALPPGSLVNLIA